MSRRNHSQNIQSFVRVRPVNSQEKQARAFNCVDVAGTREVVIKESKHDRLEKKFTFDRAFGPNSKQIDVYKSVVAPLIEEVMLGYNCTVFAYGQTGTGKTFTMEGEKSCAANPISWEDDPLSGIIPRAVAQLFDELRLQGSEFTMRVSFLELYNEELFDLLSAETDTSRLRLYEDTTRKGSVIVQGLEEVPVLNKHEVYRILEKGSAKRQTAATLMNAHSSRSHTLFTITVHVKESSIEGEEMIKSGKLYLVDLAGSENIGRSGAVAGRAREAGNINQSLLTLGRVIKSLVEKTPHIPYRESKLTRLLQDSLGGRTKTSIIATISPASTNYEETISTLDYAHRAKSIQNKPEVNQKLTKTCLLKDYTTEIDKLRKDLMASRDQNGVYLAQDNYQEMMKQIECQSEEITENIKKIGAMKQEMDRKQNLFEEIGKTLSTTKVELKETCNKLDHTTNVLKGTEKSLKKTQFERDEQKFIVQKHEETEQALSDQAKSLLSVAKESTKQVETLHKKISKQKSLEENNTEVLTSLKENFDKELKSIMASEEKVMNDQCSFFNNQVQELLNQRNTEKEQLSSITQQQIQFLNSQLESFKNLESHLQTQEEEMQRNISKSNRTCEQSLENALDILKKHKEEFVFLFSSIIQHHHNQLNTVQIGTDTITKLISSYNDTFQANLQVHKEKTVHIQEFYDRTAANQLHVLETSRNHVDTMCREHSVQSANISKLLHNIREDVALIESNVAEVNKSTAHGTQQIIPELEQGHIHLTAQAAEGNGLVQDLITCGHAMLDRNQEFASNHNKLLDDNQQSIKCCSDKFIELTDSLHTAHTVFLTSREESASSARREAGQHCDVMATCAAAALTTSHQHIQNLTESSKNRTAVGASQVTGLEECVSVYTDARTKEMQGQVQAMTDHGHGFTDRVCKVNQDMQAILTHDIQQYVPTGSTPVRRAWSYPRYLAATSPHKRILQRYRNQVAPPFAEEEDGEGDSSVDSDGADYTALNIPAVTQPDELTKSHSLNDLTTGDTKDSPTEDKENKFAIPKPNNGKGFTLRRATSARALQNKN